MAILTLLLIILRLWIQNFTTPEFRVEDNPIAAAEDLKTRYLSQNYLYSLNFFLLLMPDWLSFDYSFSSIRLLEDFRDWRVFGILGFYSMMGGILLRGFVEK